VRCDILFSGLREDGGSGGLGVVSIRSTVIAKVVECSGLMESVTL